MVVREPWINDPTHLIGLSGPQYIGLLIAAVIIGWLTAKWWRK